MLTTKRCISLLLVLVMVLGMIPASALAIGIESLQTEETFQTAALTSEPGPVAPMGTSQDGLDYEVYSDHVEIVGYTGSETVLAIPDQIEGLPVTKINDHAFSYCISLTSITLPDSVTSIEDGAFSACTSLTSITIPENITYIEGNTFSWCSSLTSIIIPCGVTGIGDSAFAYCSKLTNITIPNGVTSIGYNAFNNCSSLTNFTIPNSVTSIGDRAFSGCSSLTSIALPDSITSIGEGVFTDCSSLTNISIPNSVTSIEEDTFRGCSNLISIILPSGITSIGSDAFSGCSNLASITIPNSVTSIGYSAFFGCSSLTRITLPGSVTRIEDGAFSGCSSLTKIEVDADNATYCSLNGILFSKQMDELVCCPGAKTGSITVPNSVTSIRSSGFEGCSNLASITIPNSVTSIGYSAFSGCSNLESITIPNSVTNIGSLTFYDCSNLASITIPNSVTRIERGAFEGCSSLISFTIPNSVTSIGNCAFRNCSSLTSITLPNRITSIASETFSGCNNLTSITIPSSVTSIEYLAFSDCSSLTNIAIPSSVTSIEASAFRYCNSLTKIEVDGDNATYCSQNGILYNKQMTEMVRFPGGNNGNITIPHSVTSIGDSAFSGCSNLASITIPNSVTNIGSHAFYDCSNLASITIPNSVTSIESGTFEGCSSLISFTIPNSVRGIGEDAFSGCNSLTNIIIPDSVTYIEYYAFYYCDNLADVYYGGSKSGWEAMGIWEEGNEDLLNATIHYAKVDAHDTLDQLTELDYLAFSKLAYRNLNQCKGKTVKEVIGSKWDEFWTDGTTTEFLNSEIYGAIANWTVYKTGSGDDGFYYAVFKAPDAGQAVLAYRGSTNPLDIFTGSEDAIGDWIWNDLPMLLGGFIGTQFGDACKAYTDLASDPEIWMITTTGHSLGGAWADAISALYGCDGVSMNAVPILDVVYDTHPQYYGATFTGLSDWNFIDHANVFDVLAGMNEALFSSAPIKPYISHKSMYTGANIATPHSLWPMVQRSSDGSVCITDVADASIPNAAMTQERKLSYVSLGSTSNDMLNKGMNSLKRQSAYGGNGEDQIYTGSSWDKLIGGAGFDVLDGGYGDDTYFYFKGDGHDYIRDIGGSDALYLYGYTRDDAIAIVEDEEIGFIDVYCNGEPVISIYEDGREYKSFTFDKFEVYVVWGNQDYDVYDITSFFKTRKYGSHLLISCPVSIEILDTNGNVVHTLTDGEVGSWYTEYGNFYVFDEENGEYGKVLDLVEGYTARIVGADEGTMDVTYQVPVDGELSEPVSVSGVPVIENLSATIEETEDGDVYLVIDEDNDGETDSERKLYGECPFTDVPEGSFYYEPVMWAVEEGITNGATETTYNPNGTCLRAQVVTFLHRADGNPEPTSTRNPFTDVKSGDFFYKPVLWAVENGITNGTTATTFGSFANCNRAAVVTFLWRAAGSPEPESTTNPFVDVKTTDFFYKPVLWAVEKGITNGVDATHFGPTANCNRAQVVTFLYRAYN